MKMTNEEYAKYVKKRSPKSKLLPDIISAFIIGGLICCLGQGINTGFTKLGLDEKSAGSATSICLILIGAVLTGLGIYDKIAKFGGAGTLVPITGYANSVVSPALEFKTEGFITGMAAKLFIIAGPVIVFGISASVVYGLILCLFNLA